eukprot:1188913-Prorocentrum_minimum.AAC.2
MVEWLIHNSLMSVLSDFKLGDAAVKNNLLSPIDYVPAETAAWCARPPTHALGDARRGSGGGPEGVWRGVRRGVRKGSSRLPKRTVVLWFLSYYSVSLIAGIRKWCVRAGPVLTSVARALDTDAR